MKGSTGSCVSMIPSCALLISQIRLWREWVPMNQEELKELIYYLSQKDISEFSIERADLAVRIKRRVEIPNEAGASLLSALVSNGAMGPAADGVLSRLNDTNGSTTA